MQLEPLVTAVTQVVLRFPCSGWTLVPLKLRKNVATARMPGADCADSTICKLIVGNRL